MRQLTLLIDCGEKTCASEPGKFCQFAQADLTGFKVSCRLFGGAGKNGAVIGFAGFACRRVPIKRRPIKIAFIVFFRMSAQRAEIFISSLPYFFGARNTIPDYLPFWQMFILFRYRSINRHIRKA